MLNDFAFHFSILLDTNVLIYLTNYDFTPVGACLALAGCSIHQPPSPILK